MKWFRFYNETIDDRKVWLLSDAELRTWIGILCLASKNHNGGDTGCNVSETEYELRCNVSVTLPKLLQLELVTLHTNHEGKETIFVKNWKKRQYQSDSSTERVKKHRENNE